MRSRIKLLKCMSLSLVGVISVLFLGVAGSAEAGRTWGVYRAASYQGFPEDPVYGATYGRDDLAGPFFNYTRPRSKKRVKTVDGTGRPRLFITGLNDVGEPLTPTAWPKATISAFDIPPRHTGKITGLAFVARAIPCQGNPVFRVAYRHYAGDKAPFRLLSKQYTIRRTTWRGKNNSKAAGGFNFRLPEPINMGEVGNDTNSRRALEVYVGLANPHDTPTCARQIVIDSFALVGPVRRGTDRAVLAPQAVTSTSRPRQAPAPSSGSGML